MVRLFHTVLCIEFDPLRSVHGLTARTPGALATCLRNSPRQARGKAHLAK